MKKKRKKHWTTKNTHLKHLKNRDDDKIKSVSRIEIILAIVGIILAILSGCLSIKSITVVEPNK